MNCDQYFAAPGVSNTMLGALDRSPKELQDYLKGDVATTKAMELGSDFHDLLLLDTKPENIEIKPNGLTFTTREGKAWKAEAEAAGKRILTQDEYDSIFGMRDSILSDSRLRIAIEKGSCEVPLFAEFVLGGTVMRKGKLDLVPPSPAIIDFKTTTNSTPRAFGKTIAERKYLRQAAYYLDLAKAHDYPHTGFLFVAVEKTPPYAVVLHYLTPEQIEAGRGQYTRLLEIYMECEARNYWPAREEAMMPVAAEVPSWGLAIPEKPKWMAAA